MHTKLQIQFYKSKVTQNLYTKNQPRKQASTPPEKKTKREKKIKIENEIL